MKKKLAVILIIAIILTITLVPNLCLAAYGGVDANIQLGGDASKSSQVMTERLVGVLQVAGTIISVIALIIIGIKYMISSVEEKSQMKGVLGYYITGCVLVFAATNVVAFLYNIIARIIKKRSEVYE